MNLKADKGHAPPGITGANATILSLILPPGTRKDDSTKNKANKMTTGPGNRGRRGVMNFKSKVVGFYRHKSILQCATGQLAISIMTRFRSESDMCFLRVEGERSDWQKKPLLQNWHVDVGGAKGGARSCEDGYCKVTEACSIHWHKLTHMRSSGMENGSSKGLNADELATMSKHRKERIFDSYMTELYPPVMLVMAGHRKEEPYFVPRTEVALPYSIEECINLCFPKYGEWCTQWNNGVWGGDAHTSAQNFLVEVVPLLACVIVQDAPYWLKHFPNHYYSLFLTQKFPMDFWREWCPKAIVEASSISDQRSINHVSHLNQAVR